MEHETSTELDATWLYPRIRRIVSWLDLKIADGKTREQAEIKRIEDEYENLPWYKKIFSRNPKGDNFDRYHCMKSADDIRIEWRRYQRKQGVYKDILKMVETTDKVRMGADRYADMLDCLEVIEAERRARNRGE